MLIKSGFKIFTRYQTKKLLIWAYWTKNFIRIFFLALDELSCFLTEIQINIFLFFVGDVILEGKEMLSAFEKFLSYLAKDTVINQ